MRPRNTLLLAIVVAALGAFVWFYEIQGGAEREKQEAASKRLFPSVEASAIESIELRTEDGANARLERAGEAGWKLVAPLATPADRFVVDGIASTLAELTPEASFDSPEALESYGLDVEPSVRFRAGDRDYALRIGADTPVGGNVYVTDAEGKRVHALASWRKNALVKTLAQLRDSRVLEFDRAAVSGIRLEGAKGHIVLARVDDAWRIAEPVAAKADPDAVDTLLSDLQYLRADGFVDAPEADAALGLDEPWFAAELSREGAEPVRLEVGAERGDRRVVRGSAGRVFEIAASRVTSLPRDLDALRWKQLASFASADAATFELRFSDPGGETVVITGKKSDTGWDSEPEGMAPGKASGLVSELSGLRAEAVFADEVGGTKRAELGLAPPRATLVVRGRPNEGHADGAVLAEVALGAPREDGRIPAQRVGEPTVYLLAANVGDSLPTSLAAWRESFRAKEEPAASPEPAAAPPATAPQAVAPELPAAPEAATPAPD